jgi:hypothetical protein
MSFFKSLANKISTVFRDDGLTSAGDNVVFTGDATVVAFVRTDVPKVSFPHWNIHSIFVDT